ncbi:hypothetical protein JTB14_003127 [Gonioctena quinquepunctata]|nr:hypothetical protein JTB14_003127 [Gonioctena quinquepunctata]
MNLIVRLPSYATEAVNNLERLYANKKKELRKKFADHEKGTYIKGGGPLPPDPKLDAADTILISMLNENTVSGFYSEFDSDNSGIFEPSEKKRKGECDTQIYEFDPATGSFIEETDSENICEFLDFFYHSTCLCPLFEPLLLPRNKT